VTKSQRSLLATVQVMNEEMKQLLKDTEELIELELLRVQAKAIQKELEV
jgi:hypothetical protein